ncbi:MAG: DUF2695 domain-containing protein [Gilvibacter sp.]
MTEAHKEQLNALPFEDLVFRKLFDHIDDMTSNYRCEHSFIWTKDFLATQGIKLESHLEFFTTHKVHCDCEILTVLDPIFPVDLNEFKRRSI